MYPLTESGSAIMAIPYNVDVIRVADIDGVYGTSVAADNLPIVIMMIIQMIMAIKVVTILLLVLFLVLMLLLMPSLVLLLVLSEHTTPDHPRTTPGPSATWGYLT